MASLPSRLQGQEDFPCGVDLPALPLQTPRLSHVLPWPQPAASTDTLEGILFFVNPSEGLLLWGWASSAHVLCEPRIRAALAAACLFH